MARGISALGVAGGRKQRSYSVDETLSINPCTFDRNTSTNHKTCVGFCRKCCKIVHLKQLLIIQRGSPRSRRSCGRVRIFPPLGLVLQQLHVDAADPVSYTHLTLPTSDL